MDFIDLKKQHALYRDEIHEAMDRVIAGSAFIGGPAVAALEDALSRYSGSGNVIACGNGTDALVLAMQALGVKAGDQVIVPNFSFFATAEAVAVLMATPIFVDIDPITFNIDASKIPAAIADETVGIIPVSLFGQAAEMDGINEVAEQNGLWVLEDGAQSFGARYKNKRSCALSDVATTSFYPAKPLGCYGDGGAIFTDDDERCAMLRKLRNHGQSKRYTHEVVGQNSRLDALQAAILEVKLRHLDDELEAKQKVAQMYTERLVGTVGTPVILDHNESAWAQYTIRVKKRDRVRDELLKKEIPTAVHYPIPLNKQPAFVDLPQAGIDFPETEKACKEVVSLPMHPFLQESEIDEITRTIIDVEHG